MPQSKMKKVTIRSKDNRGVKSLDVTPGKFLDDQNNTWYLTNNGQIKTDDPSAPQNQQVSGNETANIHRLRLRNTSGNSVTIDKTTKLGAAISRFYKKHPSAEVVYDDREMSVDVDEDLQDSSVPTPSKGEIKFEIVDHEAQSRFEYQKIKQESKIQNLIYQMDEKELYDTAYDLQIARPHEKNPEEIFVAVSKKAREMGESFVEAYEQDDRRYRVVASKAIEYRIITPKDDGSYYFGNDLLGKSLDDIVIFMRNNPKTYERSIKAAVDYQDSLHFGWQTDSEVKEEKETAEAKPEDTGETAGETADETPAAGQKQSSQSKTAKKSGKQGGSSVNALKGDG